MTDRTPKFLALALTATALAGCAKHADSSAAAAEVRQGALDAVADYNAQDAHKSAMLDAPDYVGVFHGAPNVNGPAADEAGMKATMAAVKVRWQIGEGKVTVSKAGDIGIFEAPYTFTITPAQGKPTTESGNWIAIFKRQDDGQMKLWRSIASDGPPATAQPRN